MHVFAFLESYWELDEKNNTTLMSVALNKA